MHPAKETVAELKNVGAFGQNPQRLFGEHDNRCVLAFNDAWAGQPHARLEHVARKDWRANEVLLLVEVDEPLTGRLSRRIWRVPYNRWSRSVLSW